ncbi:HPr family phosphocarrier protein [Paenibacillus sp. SYP-B3998]|uniref:HPr family phosphocarrier protein n=1 Tax=Paenibacillus sp. SYP-B3998 TaxID=2678564 RepID=A0A6G3ZX85_9BACL|nr:HPr family phosphocarrier protein [Paenibacillus sp. SYP-B3998]NEW06658.1 HPr family phosphocarrier protein [Paenibacillus sp. SYP-B3998]
MRVHEFVIQSEIQRRDLTDISSQSAHFISEISIDFIHNEVRHVVDVKSLLGMLLVPIKSGTLIRLLTKGKDEEEAMHVMFELFQTFQ